MSWFKKYIQKIVRRELQSLLNDKSYREAIMSTVRHDNNTIKANENDMYMLDMRNSNGK